MVTSVLLVPPGLTRRHRMLRRLNNFSAKEIAAEFGIEEKEVREARKLPHMEQIPYMVLMDAIVRFVNKTGRWPTGKDWRNENGLPSWSTVTEFLDWPGRAPTPIFNGIRERRRTTGSQATVQWLVAHHRGLKPKGALALTNATHRRDAMARFTPEKLVSHMTLVDDDKEVGKLYRTTDQCFLRVVNSTPEPDGSRAVYALSVPPEMQKARQALAWTFGVTEGWENFKIGSQS